MTEPRYYVRRSCVCIGVIDSTVLPRNILHNYADHKPPAYVWHENLPKCPTCGQHAQDITPDQVLEAERVCAELNAKALT